MNLAKKKSLAAKALGVGKGRLQFKQENLSEIKEAITREDIKQLNQEGIISIKPIKGRKTNVKRKHRRGPGKIKMRVNKRKQEYVKITRKLREYISSLKERGVLDRDLYITLRKKIRMRDFKSKANLKDYLKGLENVDFDFVSKDKKPETKKIKKKIEAKVKKTSKTKKAHVAADHVKKETKKVEKKTKEIKK